MRGQPLPDEAHLRIVAPASPPRDHEVIPDAIENLRALGFRPSLGASIWDRNGFLAGSDRARARDLHSAFRARSVDGVMCLRGGYGSQRLLSLLDLKPCAQSGKPLIGFSDITALLGVFARFGGWAIHGPMAGSLVSDASVSHFSRDHLKAALFEPDRERSVREGYDHAGETIEVARTGTVSGRLIGGNLTILTSLLGTPWFPSLKGAILFIEDVGEAPYRIDRMVTHLINSGVLAGVRGIAAGLFASCDAVDATGEPQPPGWRRVIQERLLPLKVPLVLGLPFGHVPFNAALPVGQTATLDAKRGDLIVGGRMMRVGLRRVK